MRRQEACWSARNLWHVHVVESIEIGAVGLKLKLPELRLVQEVCSGGMQAHGR